MISYINLLKRGILKSEKSYKHLDKIENIGVVLRPQSPELKDIFSKIEDLFFRKKY